MKHIETAAKARIAETSAKDISWKDFAKEVKTTAPMCKLVGKSINESAGLFTLLYEVPKGFKLDKTFTFKQPVKKYGMQLMSGTLIFEDAILVEMLHNTGQNTLVAYVSY